MANIPENEILTVNSIDPELERICRECAIGAGLVTTQIIQVANYPETDKEPENNIEPIDECSSTFSGL